MFLLSHLSLEQCCLFELKFVFCSKLGSGSSICSCSCALSSEASVLGGAGDFGGVDSQTLCCVALQSSS